MTSAELQEAVEAAKLIVEAYDAKRGRQLPIAFRNGDEETPALVGAILKHAGPVARALLSLSSRVEGMREECAKVALDFRKEMLANVAEDSMEALAATIAINEVVQRIRSLPVGEGPK
jgi:hypothetical protein